MADIRIKDLTTLESASLSGDVFVIDGTTGTRKLNAFSPTFGGNATVTGTLTANTSVNSPQLVISDNSLGLTGGAGFYKKEADTVALGVMTSNTLRAWIRTTDARWFYQSGTAVTIQDTTASTSTSSGALVVSGGVGVAGAVYAGEEVVVNRTSSDQTLLRIYSTGGNGNFINFAETSIGGQGTGVAFLRWTRGGNQDRAFSVHVSNSSGTSIKATTVDASGNLIQALNGTAPSLATNSTMTFELTSNTSLKIFVRGSDGTTRSTTLTLA